ncbi:unnamed protein product [Linum trigynum]|uniref:Uncharacterized protein n=1 Tax=Linum trigynum TaxID=586398 RepID=A0AAV2DMY4_9ROSI
MRSSNSKARCKILRHGFGPILSKRKGIRQIDLPWNFVDRIRFSLGPLIPPFLFCRVLGQRCVELSFSPSESNNDLDANLYLTKAGRQYGIERYKEADKYNATWQGE